MKKLLPGLMAFVMLGASVAPAWAQTVPQYLYKKHISDLAVDGAPKLPIYSGTLSASTSSLSLTNSIVPTTTSADISVLNEGPSSAQLTSVSASGGFSATYNCGSVSTPIVIAYGATCLMHISAASSSTDQYGQLSITYNDGAQLQVQLFKPKSLPDLTLSTHHLTFDSINAGQSATMTVSMINGGLDTVIFNSVPTITASTPFTLNTTGTNPCGSSLAVGSSCDLIVTFNPTSSTPANATITVDTNAPSSPDLITVSGTGLQGVGALTIPSGSSNNFGGVAVGSSSTKNYTFTNNGNIPITGVYAATSGNSAAIMTVTTGNTCGTAGAPISLAAGASCNVAIKYAPTTWAASSSAVLSVYSSASNSTQTLTMVGIPLDALGSLSPTSWSIGSFVVGSTPVTKVFTYTNSASGGLSTNVYPTITGTVTTGLSITANTCGTAGSPATINTGGTCSVTVQWNPSAVLSLSGAKLTINSSVAHGAASANITGTATQPNIALTADTSTDFGTVKANTTASLNFTVHNSGSGAASGMYASVTGTGVAMTYNNCGTSSSKISFAANATCYITVSYTPTTNASMLGSVVVTSSAPSSPNTLALTGLGDTSVTYAMTGAMQTYTVPTTGVYAFDTVAGGGGTENARGYTGGGGTRLTCTVSLTAGTVVNILVGQGGGDGYYFGSGGGGSFVVTSTGTKLCIAGGGGGAGNYTNGQDGQGLSGTGVGGVAIGGYYPGAGGGGYSTDGANGTNVYGGKSYLNGGAGGGYNTARSGVSGGYGGGSAGGGGANVGGSGGGYDGGQGNNSGGAGYGGTSYSGGATSNLTTGYNHGDGWVKVSPS